MTFYIIIFVVLFILYRFFVYLKVLTLKADVDNLRSIEEIKKYKTKNKNNNERIKNEDEGDPNLILALQKQINENKCSIVDIEIGMSKITIFDELNWYNVYKWILSDIDLLLTSDEKIKVDGLIWIWFIRLIMCILISWFSIDIHNYSKLRGLIGLTSFSYGSYAVFNILKYEKFGFKSIQNLKWFGRSNKNISIKLKPK